MKKLVLINRALITCVDFARQYVYYINSSAQTVSSNEDILIYIHNNFLDMAVIQWTHLYGSRSDQLHYRNLSENPVKFKAELLEKLSINESQWDKYWNEMKDYRDKGVAHIEPVPTLYVPELELAYKSVVFYYNHFISELKDQPDYYDYPYELNDYALSMSDKYADQVELIFDALYTPT